MRSVVAGAGGAAGTREGRFLVATENRRIRAGKKPLASGASALVGGNEKGPPEGGP